MKFVKIMAQAFLISESTCDLTEVSPSMYDSKTAVSQSQRSLSLPQALLEGKNALIWRR